MTQNKNNPPNDQPSKKGAFRSAGRFFGRRAKGIGRRINPDIGYDQDGRPISSADVGIGFRSAFVTIGKAFSLVFGGLRSRKAWIRPDRQRVMFQEKAANWGVNRQNIKRLLRNIRIEMGVYAVGLMYGLVQMVWALWTGFGLNQWLWFGLGGLLAMFFLTNLAIAAWRLDILRQQRFRPFSQWIFGN